MGLSSSVDGTEYQGDVPGLSYLERVYRFPERKRPNEKGNLFTEKSGFPVMR